jgi:hypothetical protein
VREPFFHAEGAALPMLQRRAAGRNLAGGPGFFILQQAGNRLREPGEKLRKRTGDVSLARHDLGSNCADV